MAKYTLVIPFFPDVLPDDPEAMSEVFRRIFEDGDNTPFLIPVPEDKYHVSKICPSVADKFALHIEIGARQLVSKRVR